MGSPPDPLDHVAHALAAWHASHPEATWTETEAALRSEIERARAQPGAEDVARRESEAGRGGTAYNLIAGRSRERLAALSDGVFAVAMTLLVFDLHVPVAAAIHSEGDLWHALLRLGPNLAVYFLSFLTLGIFWVGQQTNLDFIARSNRDLAWLNLGFLLTVTIIPFSTALLAAFPTYRIAILVYWLNILLLGLFLLLVRRYAAHAGLDREDVTAEMQAAAYRRIVVAQALYAIATLFCLVDARVSVGLIFLVQLNYVLAPRLPILYRL